MQPFSVFHLARDPLLNFGAKGLEFRRIWREAEIHCVSLSFSTGRRRGHGWLTTARIVMLHDFAAAQGFAPQRRPRLDVSSLERMLAPNTKKARRRSAIGLNLVAGTGFEPVTFRL